MSRARGSGSYPPSPVPGDRNPWPLELPFTAFGQFGVDALDMRVFDQDVYWVDRTGTPHLLAELSAEYVCNVIAFLIEYRDYFFEFSVRRAFITELGDQLLFGEPSGEALARAIGAPAWSELTPEAWLEGTPLMRTLRRLCPSVPRPP